MGGTNVVDRCLPVARVEAVHTRCCRTCRWYVRENGGQGSCSNPQMVTELGFAPSVRELELHCRKGWNSDLWQASADDVVLEIRTKQPDAQPGSNSTPTSSVAPVEPDDPPMPAPIDGVDRVISFIAAADR